MTWPGLGSAGRTPLAWWTTVYGEPSRCAAYCRTPVPLSWEDSAVLRTVAIAACGAPAAIARCGWVAPDAVLSASATQVASTVTLAPMSTRRRAVLAAVSSGGRGVLR